MISEGTVGKILGGTLAGGAVLALAEGVPPDSTGMMYSLALAVVGLAGLAFKTRRTTPPPERVSNSDLMSKLEDFAYGSNGLSGRIQRLDEKIDTLTGTMGTFRETTRETLADHRARINGLENER